MEKQFVQGTYKKIASHFSLTRENRIWDGVSNFLQSFGSQKTKLKLLDYGCGNGKYIPYFQRYFDYHACDNCTEFVQMIQERYPNIPVMNYDVCKNAYPDNTFDIILCIAVLHHLESPERRNRCISEINRILNIGGECLLTVWTSDLGDDQPCRDLRDCRIFRKAIQISDHQDFLIPYREHLRYYHLFSKEELISLFVNHTLEIKKIYYEMNNYGIILKKIK
jgi:SAM-dependent methyltransferase